MPPDNTPMLSRPANADIGGINCTMTPTFGCNWEIEEALAPPVMTESIPEPTNPANTIVSVVAKKSKQEGLLVEHTQLSMS